MHSKKSRKRTSVKPPSSPLSAHPERTSRASGWAPKSSGSESGEREITARPKGPGEMPHGSFMVESGLSVDPEDLGREFLAHATEQDNYESISARGAVEEDEPTADDAIPSGASSDDPELWGRTVDLAAEEAGEYGGLDELDGFDTRDGLFGPDVDALAREQDDDDDIEDDDLGELGTVGLIGNLGEHGDGEVEGWIDLDDDELIEVISVEQLDVLDLLTIIELEALGPVDEAPENGETRETRAPSAKARSGAHRASLGKRPKSGPPPVPPTVHRKR